MIAPSYHQLFLVVPPATPVPGAPVPTLAAINGPGAATFYPQAANPAALSPLSPQPRAFTTPNVPPPLSAPAPGKRARDDAFFPATAAGSAVPAAFPPISAALPTPDLPSPPTVKQKTGTNLRAWISFSAWLTCDPAADVKKDMPEGAGKVADASSTAASATASGAAAGASRCAVSGSSASGATSPTGSTGGSHVDGVRDWVVGYNPNVQTSLSVELNHTIEHTSVVCCVRFSNDGKFIATGCNRSAQVYDVQTGERVHLFADDTMKEGDLYIRSVAFSPNGLLLAAGAEDKTVKIWDINARRLSQTFAGHDLDIYSLDFSPDGRFVVSGSGDKKVKIWVCRIPAALNLYVFSLLCLVFRSIFGCLCWWRD